MVVTYENLYSEAQLQLKNFLKNNLVDPINRFKKDWILSQKVVYPSSVDFVGYPYVVVNSLMTGVPDYSNDLSLAFIPMECMIDVYSSDLAFRDSVSNDIWRLLNDRTNRDVLRNEGLRMIKVRRDVDEDFIDSKRVFVARFTLSMVERMEVTV